MCACICVFDSQSVVFSFEYSWCLQVVRGKAEQIKFLVCETSGGGQKPDPFGMVSPTLGESSSLLTLSQFARDEEGHQAP